VAGERNPSRVYKNVKKARRIHRETAKELKTTTKDETCCPRQGQPCGQGQIRAKEWSGCISKSGPKAKKAHHMVEKFVAPSDIRKLGQTKSPGAIRSKKKPSSIKEAGRVQAL